jgi:phosphoribosylformylglycinamidine synthase
VSCTGATPVAATNCLNFGNPEKPQIMGQFSEVVDGLTEACLALETPITGGNVSLYNETLGEGIYPTPVVGIVGILENVDDAMTFHFRHAEREIFVLRAPGAKGAVLNAQKEIEFGSSEYAKDVLDAIWGLPPALDLKQEVALQKGVRELIHAHAIESAHDVAECGFVKPGLGAEIELNSNGLFAESVLFGEDASRILVTCDSKKAASIQQTAVKWGLTADRIGRTVPEKLTIRIDGKIAVAASVSELKQVWDAALVTAISS